jgi:hypothetical protein
VSPPSQSRTPPLDIRLGDILVGLATGESAGLIAVDLGKETGGNGFQLLRSGHVLANTETVVRSATGSIKLRAPNETNAFLPYYESIMHKNHTSGIFIDPGQGQDYLYQVDDDGVEHLLEREQRPDSKRIRVWYGPIGSGGKPMKNARRRNELRDKYNIISWKWKQPAPLTVFQLPSFGGSVPTEMNIRIRMAAICCSLCQSSVM